MAWQNLPPPKPLDLDPLHVQQAVKQTVTKVNTDVAQATSNAAAAVDPLTALDNLFQQIYDKIQADGNKIIADMTKAQAIAATKLPDGSVADQPSNQCLTALIPVIQLIVDNQLAPTAGTGAAQAAVTGAPATPDGVVTAFVKVRVVVNALQGASVQSNCSWLAQTIQQAGTEGLANILGGLLGITKLTGLGIAIP